MNGEALDRLAARAQLRWDALPEGSIAYGLDLGGGSAFGATEVWPALETIALYGRPRFIIGTSVGALNAILLAAGTMQLALDVWRDVDGAGWFQRLQPDVWNGLHTLKPLRKQVKRTGVLDRLQLPVYAGVVDLATLEHRIELVNGRRRALDIVIASCSQPMVHERIELRGRWVADGGVRAMISPISTHLLDTIDRVVAIGATPQGPDRVKRPELDQKEVAQSWEQAGVALTALLDGVAARDYATLRGYTSRCDVLIASPPSWHGMGNQFDASPEIIRRRLGAHGLRSWQNRRNFARRG